MGSLARDHSDPELLGFIKELLEEGSLNKNCEKITRTLLQQGTHSLSAEERVVLETEIIEPYLGDCEGCGTTPSWAQMLHVYDTGLCATCFDRLEGEQVPAVRPDWMPLAAFTNEDDELPASDDLGALTPQGA
ncbi:MAG: hypothetical protein ACR2QB_11555 [Gammaproteobacteria bacterium]